MGPSDQEEDGTQAFCVAVSHYGHNYHAFLGISLLPSSFLQETEEASVGFTSLSPVCLLYDSEHTSSIS